MPTVGARAGLGELAVTFTETGTSAKTIWLTERLYAGRRAWIRSDSQCLHLDLDIVCSDPKYGDSRVYCSDCGGVEA